MSNTEIFKGAMTALVTPFRDGAVDMEAAEGLMRWQVDEGIDGLVISGTTGESPTLTEDERLALTGSALRIANGKIPVIVGTGSNNTAHAIESSRNAEDAGADGLLLVTPYYNKPTQSGLLAHYRAIADAVSIPICLYSVPGRTALGIAPETVAALAEHPNIAALKEAGGSVERITAIRQRTDLSLLSGDDPIAVPMIAAGAKGLITVIGNVAPRETRTMISDALNDDFAKALLIHDRLYPLMKALFLETNPVPAKEALHMMGRIGDELRLPLVPMQAGNRARLADALRAVGIEV
jgi:4-hydroxy-tetrahydrodipicolinate synthase